MLEPVSVDEALLDVSSRIPEQNQGHELVLASKIRDRIFEKTRCPASVGISHNILLARLANRRAKPNGQYLLPLEDVPAFLSELSVDDLPGVGWSLTEKLKSELVNFVHYVLGICSVLFSRRSRR